MNYPEGLPSTAFCTMEGCNWRGGNRCVNCGARLTCVCGRFVREDDFTAHVSSCPTITRLSSAVEGTQ